MGLVVGISVNSILFVGIVEVVVMLFGVLWVEFVL